MLKIYGGLPISMQNAYKAIISMSYKAPHHKSSTSSLAIFHACLFPTLSPTQSIYSPVALPLTVLQELSYCTCSSFCLKYTILPQYYWCCYEDLLKNNFLQEAFLSCVVIEPFVHFYHCTYYIRSKHTSKRWNTTFMVYKYIYRAHMTCT